jgi:DNA-directed RNA polymerase specialized sigma24 family protein
VFPYTFSIAHHHFVDSTRREKYEQLASTETPEEVELPSEAPQADDALDGKRRLVALEELSVAEAAEVLQTEGRCPDEGRRASELTPAAGSAQRRAVRRRASGHRAA